MKKCTFFLLILMLIMAVPVVEAQSVYTIKISYVSPELTYYQNYETNFIATFRGYVERESGGRIKVQSFPAGQLGAQRESLEGATAGTIEMVSTADAPLSGFFKESMILSTPGLFASIEEANDIFKGPWGQAFNERLRKAMGLRVLSHITMGFRNFTTKARKLKGPEDAKGLKFRVMESPVPIKMVEALSATATPMPGTEMYAAMQHGVVDGHENAVMNIIQDKTYEVQKYLVLDGHVASGQFWLISDRFFNSLPADLQKVVLKGVERGERSSTGLIYVMQEVGLDFLKKHLEIYTPTPEEAKRWRDAVSGPTQQFVRSQVGDKAMDDLLAAIAAYRKSTP